jgi:hypothetical protein
MGFLKDKLKGLLFPEPVAFGEPPPWVSRLQDSRFVSLSGVDVPFVYLDLRALFPKKTAVFQSAIGDGAYIQDNGIGGFRFPMMLMFTGGDHDIQANIAIQALLEKGEGTLYHPIFGPITVVAGGEIEYVSNLVSEANQTSIIVEFFETTGLQIGESPPFDSVLELFKAASADSFAAKLELTDVADEANFIDRVQKNVGKIKTELSKISTGVANAQAAIDDTADSISRGIDTLIGDPLTLGRQMQRLIASPARIGTNIRSKLRAYGNLAIDIFGLGDPKPTGYDFQEQNGFHLNVLTASNCLSSAAESAVNNDLTTKSEYIESAVSLLQLADELSTWKDDGFAAISDDTIGSADTGDGWGDLIDIMNMAAAELISQSFAAATEYKITTDHEDAASAWCYRFYKSVKNEQLWFFANTNNLGGDELLTIPAGRELVYYV